MKNPNNIENQKLQILAQTNQGVDYYKYHCTDIIIGEGDVSSNSVQHPYLNGNKTFFIYIGYDYTWRFRYDLDGKEYKGDMFDFCAGLTKLDVEKDIEKIIEIISEELNLDIESTSNPETFSGSKDEDNQEGEQMANNTIPDLNPTTDLAEQKFFPVSEIVKASATTDGQSQICESDKSDESDNIHELISQNRKIPNEIYSDLPPFINSVLDIFLDKREKDIVLLSLLAVFSGTFPKVIGTYNRKQYSLNVFLALIAPAGAGKSAAQWARKLAHGIHKVYLDMGKSLFIPADTSFAAILTSLHRNDGIGILYAPEIDTLAQNLKKEWGDISPLLRHAFEHEVYENMRRGDNFPVIRIDRPSMSVLLTGTPNQLPKLIPNIEDGLFSRFCLYTIELDPRWQNVFLKQEESGELLSIDQLLVPLQNEALEIFQGYNQESSNITFGLTHEQEQLLNEHFKSLSNYFADSRSFSVIATIRRLGLITFRVAGVLSAIRNYKSTQQPLVCTDSDFRTALTLSDVFLANALEIAEQLPDTSRMPLKWDMKRFFDALPLKFNRETANSIGTRLGIKIDTVDKYLTKLRRMRYLGGRYNSHVKI